MHHRNHGGVVIAATDQILLPCGRELTTDSLVDCTLVKDNRETEALFNQLMKNGLPLSTFLLYFGEEWRHIGILFGSTVNQEQTAWRSGFTCASVLDCANQRSPLRLSWYIFDQAFLEDPAVFLQISWERRESVLRSVTCGTQKL